MAEFNAAMITEAGKKLLADTLSGKSKLKFYCIGTGNGIYDGTENLKTMTDLKAKKQEAFLNSISKVSDNCVKVKALISNENSSEGYYITEMGLYAIDEMNVVQNPVLYSIVTAERADYFPAYDGKTPVTILQEYYATVSETAKVDIYINDDIFALAEDFDKLKRFVDVVYTEAKNKDGGNADMVDGKHASDLMMYYDLENTETDVNTVLATGIYRCVYFINYPKECPDGQGTLIVINYGTGNIENVGGTMGTNHMWLTQIFYSPHEKAPFYRCIVGNTVSDWVRLDNASMLEGKTLSEIQNYDNLTNKPTSLPANGGNADTVGGKTLSEIQNYNNLTNKPTSLPANGGNADTVDGKHASEFTGYRSFNTFEELSETEYEGLFYIESEGVTGVSLKSGEEHNSQPDGTSHMFFYTRLYSDNKDFYIQTDYQCYVTYLQGFDGDESVKWNHYNPAKKISFEGHTHDKSDITGLPESLPANGGNADTVGGKTLSEVQNYNNLTNKPTSLPANGGNADTVDGKHADDFAEKEHNHSSLTELKNLSFRPDEYFGHSWIDISQNKIAGRNDSLETDMLPIIENFSEISAEKFIGNGSKITNVNADTVDGKHASDLMRYYDLADTPTDVNTVLATGIYRCFNYSNLPDGCLDGQGTLIVINYTAANYEQNSGVAGVSGTMGKDYMWLAQIFYSPHNGVPFYRYVAADSVSDWIRLDNASMLNGKQASDFVSSFKITNSRDWNTLNENGVYSVKTTEGTNRPVQNHGSLFVDCNVGTPYQMFIPDGENSEIYKRRLNGEWNRINLGCSELGYSKTVRFNISAGNWFRFIHSNGSKSCGGVFSMTIQCSGYASTTVFSASQQYSNVIGTENAIKKLTHAAFYGCAGKLRIVNKYNESDHFIDVYISQAAGATGTITVSFFGFGWEMLDSVETANIPDGYTATEIEL